MRNDIDKLIVLRRSIALLLLLFYQYHPTNFVDGLLSPLGKQLRLPHSSVPLHISFTTLSPLQSTYQSTVSPSHESFNTDTSSLPTSHLPLQQQQQQPSPIIKSSPRPPRPLPASSSSSRSVVDNQRSHIRRLFAQAKLLERKGQWRKACRLLRTILSLDACDAHSHLALARLEARRAGDADVVNDHNATQQQQQHIVRATFANGTLSCPDSVYLWQAWAVYEDSVGNHAEARRLFERALQLDQYNPYVCHAFGRLEKKENNWAAAMQLWQQALQKHSTAALVCSLGEAYLVQNQTQLARQLYQRHVRRVRSSRERVEIYLALAWLEERYCFNFDQAVFFIQQAIACSDDRGTTTTTTTSSVAQIALARLEARRRQALGQGEQDRKATIRRLATACIGNEATKTSQKASIPNLQHSDGRVYNAWANMEVKAKRFSAAQQILQRGLRLFPNDHSLLQAAGKVEERMGNFVAARDYYSASLRIEPSAPTLVSYALLELRQPVNNKMNLTKIIRLFEEALMLDARHGPAYNAYARTLAGQNNINGARAVLERGLRAQCPDKASIYHGYARLELSVGNMDRARDLLIQGQREAHQQEIGKDSPHRERAAFLTHTLGMLELNRNCPLHALKVFQEGIQRYGNSSQLLLGAALCEVKLGNEEKARRFFELSVLNDERHAHAWQAWGVMEMRAGDMKTAKTLFECGIKSAPHHGALWQAYATMESRVGNIENARALFAKGICRSPKHIPLYQSWASMELRENNYTASKALITEALTRDKKNGAGWIIAAEIEERLGNTGLMILLLRRGIECSPTTPELYRALGDVLVRKGNFNEARDIFEKGIEVDPTHAPLYHTLAELEARIFNVVGLAKLHKRATQIFNTNVMEPAQLSSEAWGSKIRASRSYNLPKGVAMLAERIVEEEIEGEADSVLDIQTPFLDKMGLNLLEDGLVGRLLSFEDQEATSKCKDYS